MESIRTLLFIVLIILTAFVIYKLCLENKISGGNLKSRMIKVIENKESNSKVVNDTRKFVENIDDKYLKEAIAHLALVEGYHFIKNKGNGIFKVMSPRGLISYIKIENNVDGINDETVICNSNQVHDSQYAWKASHYYKDTSVPSTISLKSSNSSTNNPVISLKQSDSNTGSLQASLKPSNSSTNNPVISLKQSDSDIDHSDTANASNNNFYVARSDEDSSTSDSDSNM